MDAPPAFHFVLDPRATRWPDLASLDERDIGALPERFVGGRTTWFAGRATGLALAGGAA